MTACTRSRDLPQYCHEQRNPGRHRGGTRWGRGTDGLPGESTQQLKPECQPRSFVAGPASAIAAPGVEPTYTRTHDREACGRPGALAAPIAHGPAHPQDRMRPKQLVNYTTSCTLPERTLRTTGHRCSDTGRVQNSQRKQSHRARKRRCPRSAATQHAIRVYPKGDVYDPSGADPTQGGPSTSFRLASRGYQSPLQLHAWSSPHQQRGITRLHLIRSTNSSPTSCRTGAWTRHEPPR